MLPYNNENHNWPASVGLTLRTPANVLTDRAGRRYSGGGKRH